jgi:hypothetical protein
MTTIDPDLAEQWGREDAEDAIDAARFSSEPITFITSNAYMPPLRDFGRAEEVWQTDDWDAWEAYCWGFEDALDKAEVLLDSPEYDNALYVVDLRRWEWMEDPEGTDLAADWVLKAIP